jgi:hypothetical protein
VSRRFRVAAAGKEGARSRAGARAELGAARRGRAGFLATEFSIRTPRITAE